MPRTLHCKEHRGQPRYNCALCSEKIKALVDKMIRHH